MTADTWVGREVHERMWDARMTQRNLAARLGMDESTIARKLRGNRKWSLDELLEVAEILNVAAADLLPPPRKPLLPHLDSNQKPTGLRKPATVTYISDWKVAA